MHVHLHSRVLRGSARPPCVTVSGTINEALPQAYLQWEEMKCPCSTSGMHGTRKGTKQVELVKPVAGTVNEFTSMAA